MRDAYEKLANAIVIQAVRDYRFCRKTILKIKSIKPKRADFYSRKNWQNEYDRWKESLAGAERELSELEAFFTSPWFEMLTNVDGKKVLKSIKKVEVA